VADVVAAITAAILMRDTLPDNLNLNMGGAERLSRLALGQRVAGVLRAPAKAVVGVSAASKDVGYDSPPDLAMDSAALETVLGLRVSVVDGAIARAAVVALATAAANRA